MNKTVVVDRTRISISIVKDCAVLSQPVFKAETRASVVIGNVVVTDAYANGCSRKEAEENLKRVLKKAAAKGLSVEHEFAFATVAS